MAKAYFCCSLGLSAGFGGLPWVCCCGVAGVAGFCGSDAEIGTFVMEISFYENKKESFGTPCSCASGPHKQEQAPAYCRETPAAIVFVLTGRGCAQRVDRNIELVLEPRGL